MRGLISLLLFLLMGVSSSVGQSIRFLAPIEGDQGRDWFIVNHVDHDTAAGELRDYTCGRRTYDGHQGTDFVLRGFRQMDSGVAVLAAADGIVFAVLDTLPDRNKISVIEQGFGNWIGLAHAGGIFTYYAHLRTGSATVNVGDTVAAGQQIAQVGSSGNSTDPHLHFEVWSADTMLLDPFGGQCSANPSLWIEQPQNDTSFIMISRGFIDWLPTLDTLREHPPTQEVFTADDSVVVLWMQMQGLREGKVQRIEWFTPDGALWFSYDFPALDRDWWYYYFWTYIDRPDQPGLWKVRYTYGLEQSREYTYAFQVEGTMSVREKGRQGGISVRMSDERAIELRAAEPSAVGTALSVMLFDLSGRHIATMFDGALDWQELRLRLPDAVPGIHLLRIIAGDRVMTLPVAFR